MKNRICIFIRLSVCMIRGTVVCAARYRCILILFLFSVPRDQKRQGIVFICIYIGVSRRTLPCTLTRRRFPIFRPETLDRKAPAFESIVPSHPSTHPIPVHSLSLRARSRRLSCATVKPSYSDKIERILPKRLRVSAVHPFVRPSLPSELFIR